MTVPASSSEQNDAFRPLDIIVVGAGIAGLATARALREHHRVTVLESSRLKTETGAAIQ